MSYKILWLDDTVKPFNDDFIWVKTVAECIGFLIIDKCDILYLDHDLGTTHTGYDVLLWIEKVLFQNENANHVPDKIVITTYNTSAKKKMFDAAMKIKQLCTALNKVVEVEIMINKTAFVYVS